MVLAIGLAATVAPLTATALGSVSESHAGLASAVNNDVARMGSLIAVAVLPALGGSPDSATSTRRPWPTDSNGRCSSPAPGVRPAEWRPPSASGTRPRPAPAPSAATDGPTHCALEATPLRGGVQR